MNYFLINFFIFSSFLFKFLDGEKNLIKRSFDDYDGGDSPPLFIDWTQPRINPQPNSFYYKNKPYSAVENGERIYPNKNGKGRGDYGPFGVGLVGLIKGEGKEESESSPLSWLRGLLFGG
ncbi:unnamed protein product [Meloidogyne enterolobii]|uniref:Uncharacterized protein n=1 Tax=Meloidogyne enterolobii TaxID=390850 RepID=A0ACB1AHL0_MELEN